jgi:hypothetical protein
LQASLFEICGGHSDTGTVAFQHCSIFIFLYVLFLPEGQIGEVWGPLKNSAFAEIG